MSLKLFLFFILFSIVGKAQDMSIKLNLDDCYLLVEEHYPLSKKRKLITASNELSIKNLASGYYPRIDLYSQASHQSDVTSLPIQLPGTDLFLPGRGQHKSYTELSQVLYDGGMIKHQMKTELAQMDLHFQQIKIELYALKQRVTDLYFGILIFDEQLRQSELYKNDISIGIKTVEAQLTNGTAYRSSLDILRAEYLKADQQAISLRSYREAYLQMLGLYINKELKASTRLDPPVNVFIYKKNQRPELTLFKYRLRSLELDKEAISVRNRPKLYFFVQGGMGNPGLNFLKSGTAWYYIGGLKLNWSLSGFYTSKKQMRLIDFRKQELEVDEEIFLFNTRQSAKQQNAEISKLEQLLRSDDEIIQLRRSVKTAALAQLENGVIGPGDYLRELNEENLAIQNKILHKTELLLAQYRQKLITGN